MKTTMEGLDKRIKTVETTCNRILFILESDKKVNSKGLVETVHDNEKAIQSVVLARKIEKATAKTTAGIFGLIGAGISAIAYIIVSAIINQKIK